MAVFAIDPLNLIWVMPAKGAVSWVRLLKRRPSRAALSLSWTPSPSGSPA